MTPEDNKILTEFVGKCWHEVGDRLGYCGTCGCGVPIEQTKNGDHKKYKNSTCVSNEDFSTTEGWQLLANRIGMGGRYYCFYDYLCGCDNEPDLWQSGCAFHEKQPADKSIIVLGAIKAGVFGENNYE